ncbi:hypothetical protein GCM10010413_40310 [Promicromonospora sukumoe]|uniref:Uncharacterized protein n=1 Tax=Promicromonospora sukumoe TaxID=88382 RepID=A0A7W3PF79_9MICO|nr:hypothetical protein [Promicromonospora sukumoe]MBA8809820.1 hypothetical protein [Promicromonospora sukumoe]
MASAYAYLTCPARRLFLGLGKPLRGADGAVTGLGWAHPPDLLPDALFTMLDDCAGADLELLLDTDDVYDDVVETWTEIDPETESQTDADLAPPDLLLITFETYLAGRTVPPATYHALLPPGLPPDRASGVVRRRGTGPDAVDQAFTRNLHWEPTEFLRRSALGMETTEHVEITAQQAADVVTRVLCKRLRPDL